MSNPLMNLLPKKQGNNNIINMIKAIKNPKQFVYDTIKQRANNNPQLQQMLDMAQNNDVDNLKNIARQMYKGDFDNDYNTLVNLIKK